MLNYIKGTLLIFFAHFCNTTFFIMYISKNNSVSRASLHASGFCFSVLQHPVFFFSSQFCVLQTLYAEAAFLHHTATANSNIRVEHHASYRIHHLLCYYVIQLANYPLILVIRKTVSTCVIRPIESTNFIWTIIGTISCPDAPVIGHLI